MIELINKYVKEIMKRLGDNLEALTLVGSYSRGEGIEGLSDIEFLGIVKEVRNVGNIEVVENVNVKFTTKEHLAKFKPYIFTVELKKFGKVLFGDKNILDLIPNYRYEDIKPLDGFILLNNRIVEQLILLNKIVDNQKINQYDFDKSYIQLVNSLLVINRQYKSLYPEKQEVFRGICKDKELLDKAELAFVSIKQPSKAAIDQLEALKKWKEVRGYFRKVWLDEIKTLGRIKCWLRVLTTSRPIRYFVYQKAASLYFSSNYQNSDKRDAVIESWEKFVK